MSHFVAYFVPLTERMFDLQLTAETEGRQSEAKVWSVLVHQIWSGLSGYCYGTVDLREVLLPDFGSRSSHNLISFPDTYTATLTNAIPASVQST